MESLEITPGTRLTNRFNRETFVFDQGIDTKEADSFTVVLESGGSGGGNALEHVHPRADEHFLVRRGAISVSIAGKKHRLGVGDSVTVRAGEPHFFENAVDDTSELVFRFSPAGNQMRFFGNFAALASGRPEWFHADGRPHLLLMALKLSVFPDCLYLAGKPIWLQKAIFSALAPIARLKGYRMILAPRKDG